LQQAERIAGRAKVLSILPEGSHQSSKEPEFVLLGRVEHPASSKLCATIWPPLIFPTESPDFFVVP